MRLGPLFCSLSVVALAVAALVACEDSSSESENLAISPCPPKGPSSDARHPTEYSKNAPHYEGNEPHLVDTFSALFSPDLGLLEEPTRSDLSSSTPEALDVIPPEWRVEASEDVTQSAQLIICQYIVVGTTTGSFCSYTGGHKISLRDAEFAYHIYEARTSKLVGKFSLQGSQDCPTTAFEENIDSGFVLRTLPEGELQRKLTPYVTLPKPSSSGS
jgi:hypothetical protein